jgi:hypothetical protein
MSPGGAAHRLIAPSPRGLSSVQAHRDAHE